MGKLIPLGGISEESRQHFLREAEAEQEPSSEAEALEQAISERVDAAVIRERTAAALWITSEVERLQQASQAGSESVRIAHRLRTGILEGLHRTAIVEGVS